MSDRADAKVQVQQKTLSGLSSTNSLLQRTCACGQHTLAGGECEECREKREGMLQRAQRAFQPPSAPSAVQDNAPAQENVPSFNSAIDRTSSFGHDFSQIPVYSSHSLVLQTKLTINQPGDVYEREADQVAERVMATPARHSVSGTLPRIQRYPGQSNGQADAAPATVDQALASPGRPLEPVLQEDMEQRFGYDFSQVQVHTDAAAEQSTQDVNALAYTVGHDIVFGAGRFAPGTHEGRRLLAHELTHVVQQSNEKSVIRRKIQFDSPTYIRENPIGKILREQPEGLTTPTFNSNSLPADPKKASSPEEKKQLYNQAGQIILDALTPKSLKYNSSTKECAFNDFVAKVSANVIIPTQPKANQWTMNFPRSDMNVTACQGKGDVPVMMIGKPDSVSVCKWIESNEQEHVDDLKKLCAKHFETYFKWLLSLKGTGDDADKCQESLMKALGNKDATTAQSFIKDWSDSVDQRDKGGKHTLHNDIQIKDHCSRVEIESSPKK